MNTPYDNDHSPWSEPDEPVSFLASRRIKRQLLEELSEPSGPTNADLADLLGRWPTDVNKDPDVAGLLFEDFRNRSLRGEPISRAKYAEEHPEHRDSMDSLFRRHDLLRSITSISEPSGPTFALPKCGDELFGYQLKSQLGQGAFARVFLAEQSELAGRLVALKTSDLTGSEPQTLAQLQHTNIVPIYSVHEDASAGIRAVCMPYFGGASLSQILQKIWKKSDHPNSGAEFVEALAEHSATETNPKRQRGRALVNSPNSNPNDSKTESLETLALANASGLCGASQLANFDFPHACAWIVARLADGLQHAHDRRVLHRDIKPGNILLGGDGTPMLLDFNLSHDENQAHSQIEATLGGTVAYMAPEHLRALNIRSLEAISQVDERSDVYGLGMVLFEMISGHNPFEQAGSYSVTPILVEAMAAERARMIPSLRTFRENVPWGLESIVRKCLQPDAEKRYQRASDLAEDLDCLLNNLPLRHAPELSRVEQIRKLTRRHPKLVASGAVGLAASLLLSLGWLALSATQTRLSAAQARVVETEGAESRELLQKFERGTLQALCLVNTHSELRNHAEEGNRICEETLGLFGILDDPDWQSRSAFRRLTTTEQRKLAEDARELLLLLVADASRVGSTQGGRDASTTLLDRAESIRNLPPSAAVWRTKAEVLRQRGEIEQADAADHQANEIPPTTARDFYLLATTHLQSGVADRHSKAIRELRQALQLDPRHYWSWMQKGLCHLEMGQSSLALADFGVCIGLWPEFAWGYFNRAFTLDQLGQKEAAIADYSAALDRDPELLAALRNRGMARLELGQFAESLADFECLLPRSPDATVLHALRGQALAGLNRFEESDAAFAIAMSDANLEPLPAIQQHQLLCSFGFAVSARRPSDAESAFARVPSDDPKYPEALYGRGLLAVTANRLERAIELFEAALNLRPNFGEPRRFRAIVLARLGRISEAIGEINTSLQSAPKSGATLYAAACVTALAAEQAPTSKDARQAMDESIRFLKQALAEGYGQHATTDDDLKAIRQHPEFERLFLK